MPEALIHLLIIAGAASALMVALWLVQRARRDASLVDAGWAFGIGAGAVLLLALGDGDPTRRMVTGALIAVWSLRLTAHLVRDRVIGKPEDGRYQELRQRWGAQANTWFFVFFQFQALLVVVFTTPFLVIATDTAAFGGIGDWAGIAIWVVALGAEALADRELAAWRRDPANRGRTCRAGLWRYSRHPNYFGEWLHWFAYVALAAASPWMGVTWLVPALLLFLLLKVTGIPPTEARALASRGDDYRAYQRTTSAFIPWFPKRDPTPTESP